MTLIICFFYILILIILKIIYSYFYDTDDRHYIYKFLFCFFISILGIYLDTVVIPIGFIVSLLLIIIFSNKNALLCNFLASLIGVLVFLSPLYLNLFIKPVTIQNTDVTKINFHDQVIDIVKSYNVGNSPYYINDFSLIFNSNKEIERFEFSYYDTDFPDKSYIKHRVINSECVATLNKYTNEFRLKPTIFTNSKSINPKDYYVDLITFSNILNQINIGDKIKNTNFDYYGISFLDKCIILSGWIGTDTPPKNPNIIFKIQLQV